MKTLFWSIVAYGICKAAEYIIKNAAPDYDIDDDGTGFMFLVSPDYIDKLTQTEVEMIDDMLRNGQENHEN